MHGAGRVNLVFKTYENHMGVSKIKKLVETEILFTHFFLLFCFPLVQCEKTVSKDFFYVFRGGSKGYSGKKKLSKRSKCRYYTHTQKNSYTLKSKMSYRGETKDCWARLSTKTVEMLYEPDTNLCLYKFTMIKWINSEKIHK